MRDYCVNPAQTNVELYQQAIEHGYDPRQRKRLAEAYLFALAQVYPLSRGSGKPFICHLVGTASLVLASDCSEDVVTAALMHALYQRRVPFDGGLPPAERRPWLVERFGTGVDDLVHRYTEFEDQDLAEPDLVHTADTADVLAVRLADELEDLCGHALALHGPPGQSSVKGGIKGDYASRREVKGRQGPVLLGWADRLGLDGIGRGLAHWLDFAFVPDGLDDMRTGWVSSVNMTDDGVR